MEASDPFELGLTFFNAGEYYEAHEVWEDVWRPAAPPLKRFYQGLIQAAVGLHHLRHGNTSGARSQLAKSILNLKAAPIPRSDAHHIDVDNLIAQLTYVHDRMEASAIRIARLK